MSNKTKNTKTTADKFNETVMQCGLVLMTAATTLGMIELPEHSNNKIIVPNQPLFAMATQPTDPNNNTLRREREENSPHYISYSVGQRTPGRTGKR